MNFAEALSRSFLLTYEGRINRQRYWAFTLVFLAYYVAAVVLDYVLDTAFIELLAVLAGIYPSVCVSIKRWHDRDKSGWWTLIGLVPIIGGIWTFIECGCLKGSDGPNRYGADPLATPALP